MKKSILILFILLTLGFNSCVTDDGLNNLNQETIILNAFCYGTEPEETFEVNKAFFEDPELTAPNVYETKIVITDNDLDMDMGTLQGLGHLLSLTLTGNENVVLQSGLYVIGNANPVGNASVSYVLNYDSAAQLNTVYEIVEGRVRIAPFGTAFAIEINGVDINGTGFHGNYVGSLTPVN
jgi:hypothetical protein